MKAWTIRFAPPLLALLVALAPPPVGVPRHGWFFFAIFAGVVVGLVLETVPGAAMGLIGVAVTATLAPWALFSPAEIAEPGFNAPDRAIAWALSGFSNATVWLAFSAFMFGMAYERTGLGRRVALCLVRRLGRRTLTLGYAIVLSELVAAPFTPSNTARSAGMVFPIVCNLPPLYESRPHDASSRRIGAYLLWVAFSTSCVTSSLFLTALAPNLMVVDLARKMAHVDITWFNWFQAAAPACLPLLIALPLLVYWLYPPLVGESVEAPKWADEELRRMGAVSMREIAVALLAVGAVALWILAPKFIHPATVALLTVAVLLFAGILSWRDIATNSEAWRTLTLLATLVTLSDGLARTGFAGWLATTAGSTMIGLSPNQAVVGLVCFYFLSHYMFASLTAHATAMLPILLTLGASMPGVAVEKLTLMLGITQGLMGVLTPYATGPAPVYASSGYIEARDFWRMGTLFGGIFLAALLLLAAPLTLLRS